jgi:hypothetical protein
MQLAISFNAKNKYTMSTETKPKAILTHEVDQKLSQLIGNSFSLSGSLQSLHLIREKIHQRHYQPHDKEAIITELERLNYQVQKLQSSMESLYHLLND